MSDLRSDATQAIAQALWSKVQDEYDDEWADIALDALLDYLETHNDEWDYAAQKRTFLDRADVADFIAVLRVGP